MRRVRVAAILACLLASAAHATTFVMMDDRQLAETSDVMLVGTVAAIESGAPNPHGPVFTYVHILPERSIKGSIDRQTIVLRELGGSLGDRHEWIYGAPEFRVGERALLFLVRNADGTLQVNNLAMGKYTVSVDALGHATATRDFGRGAAILVPTDGRIVDAVAERQAFLPLLKRLRSRVPRHRTSHQPTLRLIPPDLASTTTEFHEAFTFISTPPVRWFEPDTGTPINYFIDANGDGTLGFATSKMAVDEALAAWTNVPTSGLILADGGTTPPVQLNTCDPPSRVIFNDPFNEIPNPTQCSGILAMGGYCASGETTTVNATTFNRITLGRLTVNDGWGGCSFWNECNIAEVLTHEIGHTVGLGHSTTAPKTCIGGYNAGASCSANSDCGSNNCESTATMAPVAHFDGRCAGLRTDDMNAVTFIYPQVVSPVPTSTTTSTLPPASPPTLTRTPTASLTRTPSLSPSPTATATTTGTATTTSTSTATPTRSVTMTATSTATLTPTRTPTNTSTPTVTRTTTSTSTATPTSSPSQTPTVTRTNTATLTAIPTATSTAPATLTPTASITSTVTDTRSQTLTATSTSTATQTVTPTATGTATTTSTSTAVATRSNTATASPTATLTASRTPANTPTPTVTRTGTSTATATRSLSPSQTPTATASPTPTATPTATATPLIGVSGRIGYYSNGLPVDGATVALGGSISAALQTGSNGGFDFDNIGSGVFGIEPQKSGDANGAASALDAVYALQTAVNLRTLTPAQQLACDVNGDGIVTAIDATLLLQYTVGLIDHFPVAETCGSDWAFIPAPAPAAKQQIVQPQVTATVCQPGSISWVPLLAPADGQDFAAVLFGDCTGNWQPTGGTLAFFAPERAQLRTGPMRVAGRQHTLRVPLYVDTSGSFQALNAEIRYDPAELALRSVHRVGSGRRATVVTNPRVPGLLKLALASSEPLTGGTVLVLEFSSHRVHPRDAVHVDAFRSE